MHFQGMEPKGKAVSGPCGSWNRERRAILLLLFSQLSRVLLYCDPMDCSLPGSSVHGILQARILEQGCRALLWVILPT